MTDDPELAARVCLPCRGGQPPLTEEARKVLLEQLDAAWQVVDGHHLERVFELPDFKSALLLTNRVGELAEANGHHPDLHLAWGRLGIKIYTHKIDGLTEADFVLAAKIDSLSAP